MADASSLILLEDSEQPSDGLLSSYDRLRRRVVSYLARRKGRLPASVVDVLLLVPDLFVLLVRLTLDKQVPASTRSLTGGALAYFVLPVDLLPEAVLGAGGFLEDVVLVAVLLSHVLGEELEPLAAKHWSGTQELRVALRDISEAAQSLLGDSLYGRLKALLKRQGVDVRD